MKHLCVSVLTTVLALASHGVLAVDESAGSSSVQAVIDTLHAYEDAWSRHDPRAVASFYFEPAIRVSQGGPKVRATRRAQEAFFGGFLPGLIKQGYASSSWKVLHVQLLDPSTAIASGEVVRLRSDKSEFQRQGVTYALWRTEEGWKIFLSSTHSPRTALELH